MIRAFVIIVLLSLVYCQCLLIYYLEVLGTLYVGEYEESKWLKHIESIRPYTTVMVISAAINAISAVVFVSPKLSIASLNVASRKKLALLVGVPLVNNYAFMYSLSSITFIMC